jgi:sulfide dehydrogenase cytochrome subunit
MTLKKTVVAACCYMLLMAEAGFAGGITGRTIGVTCSACHGPEGKSNGVIPSLYGMSAKQLESALLAFKSGKRNGTIMNRIAKGYTDNEIAAVAEYFANLE